MVVERKRRTSDTDDIAKQVDKHTKKLKEPSHKEGREKMLIPSGSTMLNLACSDTATGAYGLGKMSNMIGDSNTGKTVDSITMMAEMAQDSKWDHFEFILDNVEAAQGGMNIERMFGKSLAERMKAPHYGPHGPRNSAYITDFFGNVGRLLRGKSPFIYVLDSLDSITTEEEAAMLDQLIDEKKMDGSFGMGKQKLSSKLLAEICAQIEDHGSYLHIISQTRDNINAGPFQPKNRRSGGRALKFYCWHEIWLAMKGAIKEKKYNRILGYDVVAKVTKNRETGKVREAEFPLYVSYGIDDIVSCIDFMVENHFWRTRNGGPKGKLFCIPGICENEGLPLKEAIQIIEGDKLMKDIRMLVEDAWNDIEDEISLDRAPKYK